MFARYVLLLSSLLSSLSALPLAPRDVVDPPITSPTAGSVWHVGQTQTVTWSTTGLPVNQTNSVGMLVLGYMYNNSENLMLNSPLATNINYTVGQVQVIVPNVPSRTDYIVVLFGDSGNASPEFTIINDTSSTTPSTTTISSGSPPSSASTPVSSAPPASPNNVAQNSSSRTTNTSPTATVPLSQVTSVHSSTSTVTASATPSPLSSTQSSGASQKLASGLGTSLSISLALIYFTFS